MKVKDLIEKLLQEDPEMRVVVDGYECGYNEVKKIYQIGITNNPKSDEKYWEGEFNETHVDDANEVALLLPRN
jgi:hypothetical protein